MKVILKETIPTLGIIGAEVAVAPGYARNYLLPQGKALEATESNRKVLAQEKAKFELQIAKEKSLAEELAKKVEKIVCKISAKVADDTKLYGSVTTHDIMEALKSQDVEIERRMLLLDAPIKEIGTYEVGVRLYKGVKPNITVEVVAEEKKD